MRPSKLNRARGKLGADTMQAFIAKCNGGNNSQEENLTDLLADLMHWAHLEFPGEPDFFNDAYDAARGHFNAELNGED